jgi:DNA-binding transcriptional regulator YiaG
MNENEIKSVRTNLNLSQEDFGKLIGARANQVSRWETGKVRMSKLYVEKLLKIMEDHGI